MDIRIYTELCAELRVVPCREAGIAASLVAPGLKAGAVRRSLWTATRRPCARQLRQT